VVAPRNTPSDIVGKFNREIAGILGMPDVMAVLSADGADPAPGSPAGFQATIVDELKKWNNLVRTSGLRLN
jgi:tripartite-type tricarboxylate transporter receptor subunit TctC